MNGETILVVDDNKEIVYSISELLKYEGYQIVKAYDGMEALKALETNQIDLILLDVMMPKLNGLSALMKLRENYRIPVIILSAKTEESDKVSGLVLGADDYVEKPYNPAELIARVKALLRRYCIYKGKEEPQEGDQIIMHDLVISRNSNQVKKKEEAVNLTEMEYQILLLLADHPKKIFSNQELYEAIWKGPYMYSANNTIMVHIRNLRKKLGVDPQNPVYIKTVWGKGYRFD